MENRPLLIVPNWVQRTGSFVINWAQSMDRGGRISVPNWVQRP